MRNASILAAGGRALQILALAAAFAVPMGYAVARPRHIEEPPAGAREYFGLSQSPGQGLTIDQQNLRLFDRSGTVGREGLGQSPFHPEGPGNVSD